MTRVEAIWDKQVNLLVLALRWEELPEGVGDDLRVMVYRIGTMTGDRSKPFARPVYLTWLCKPPKECGAYAVAAIPTTGLENQQLELRFATPDTGLASKSVCLSVRQTINTRTIAKSWGVICRDKTKALFDLEIEPARSTPDQSETHKTETKVAQPLRRQPLEPTTARKQTPPKYPEQPTARYTALSNGAHLMATYHSDMLQAARQLVVQLAPDRSGIDLLCPPELEGHSLSLSWGVIPFENLWDTRGDKPAWQKDLFHPRMLYTPQWREKDLVIHLPLDWSRVRPLSRVLIMQYSGSENTKPPAPVVDDPGTSSITSGIFGTSRRKETATKTPETPMRVPGYQGDIVFAAQSDEYEIQTYRDRLFCAAWFVEALAPDRILPAYYPLDEGADGSVESVSHAWANHHPEFADCIPEVGNTLGYTAISLFAFFQTWSLFHSADGAPPPHGTDFEEFVRNPNRLLLAARLKERAHRQQALRARMEDLPALFESELRHQEPNNSQVARVPTWRRAIRETSRDRNALWVTLDIMTDAPLLTQVIEESILPDPEGYAEFAIQFRDYREMRESFACLPGLEWARQPGLGRDDFEPVALRRRDLEKGAAESHDRSLRIERAARDAGLPIACLADLFGLDPAHESFALAFLLQLDTENVPHEPESLTFSENMQRLVVRLLGDQTDDGQMLARAIQALVLAVETFIDDVAHVLKENPKAQPPALPRSLSGFRKGAPLSPGEAYYRFYRGICRMGALLNDAQRDSAVVQMANFGFRLDNDDE